MAAVDATGAQALALNSVSLPDNFQNLKTQNIALRILKSPLFWALTITAALITFTAVALLTPVIINLGLSMIFIAGLIGVGTLGGGIFIVLMRQRLLFEASLSFTLVYQKEPCNEIIPNLFLSRIPLKTPSILPDMGKIENILSMVQPHEFLPGMTFEPLTPQDVTDTLKMGQKIIETPDFNPIDPALINEGVEFIHSKLSAGQSVLVHCKAGVGRSATVVIAYLLKYHSDKYTDVNAAFDFVKSKRSVIHLNARQRQAVEDYRAKYCLVK